MTRFYLVAAALLAQLACIGTSKPHGERMVANGLPTNVVTVIDDDLDGPFAPEKPTTTIEEGKTTIMTITVETSQPTVQHTTTTTEPKTGTTNGNGNESPTNVPDPNTPAPGSSFSNLLYFTNWGIYGANFQPQDLILDHVTHLLYAFADISPDGSVISSDTYSDFEKHYDGDSWDNPNNAYGSVKQLYLHKKKNRTLKTLLSIGGWTYSLAGKFKPATSTQEGRERFCNSAVGLLADWGFDGLDIDYEYPTSKQEGKDFTALLQTCRKALDDYAANYTPGYRYLLTIASSAGPEKYENYDFAGMDQYVDSWNLMAYDYAGSWDPITGHQANLYGKGTVPEAIKYNTDDAVNDYLDAGIKASKIMLGLPLYGRSFMATEGLGKPYAGVGQGSIEMGVWLYKDLPRGDVQVGFNEKIVGAWSYNKGTKELVTYDNVESAKRKVEYIKQRGLGGAFYWEAAGDKTGTESLVNTVGNALGVTSGKSQNQLHYPNSRFENIRKGME